MKGHNSAHRQLGNWLAILFFANILVAQGAVLNIDVGASDRVKTGFAATGISNDDFWNVAITAPSQVANIPNLKLAGGGVTSVGLTVINGPGLTGFNYPGVDAMYKACCYQYGGVVALTLTNMPSGQYDFYLYGHAGADHANTVFELVLGAQSLGTKSTATNGTWSSTNWIEGAQYVLYSNVRVTNGSPVIVRAHPGADGYSYMNGVQIAPAAPFSPVISVQPTDQGAYVGADVTFSVTADGWDSLSYQWAFEGTNILTGATSSSLTLTNVQLSQAGNYSVLLSNAYGSVTSSNALLFLTNPPSFLRLRDTTNDVDGAVIMPVVLIAKGDEHKVAFSLSFDPARLTYVSAGLGSGADGATVLVDTNQTGSVGAVLTLPGAATYSLGSHELVTFNFSAIAPTFLPSLTLIAFADIPTVRRVSDAQDNALDASFNSAIVTLGPLGSRPPLRIRQSNQVIISWPLWATNFILQEAPTVSGPGINWTNSSALPVATNGESVVTTPPAGVSKFYRLSTQSNSYSANVVGYYNVVCPANQYMLLGNPLHTTNDVLGNVIPNPIPNSIVQNYLGGYTGYSFDDVDLVWVPNGNLPLPPGQGFFFKSPTATTLTFVGEVLQGQFTNTFPKGQYTIRASIVPQLGRLTTDLGLPGEPNDILQTFNYNWTAYSFDDIDLAWVPSEPTNTIGRGFFYKKATTGTRTSWIQNFTVQ